MAQLVFRDLKADEVECRVSTCSQKGVSLLLYKDARCDMNILDETVGAFNWQRTHSRDNANCTVSIWDAEKGAWISKEDVGTESNTEAIKGLASDSFKRACFNWGIGRELYTAPFIWVQASESGVFENNGKWKTYDTFVVKELYIENKRIIGVTIYNATKKKVCYTWGKSKHTKKTTTWRDALREFCKTNNIDQNNIVQVCGLHKGSTEDDFYAAYMYAYNMIYGGTQG